MSRKHTDRNKQPGRDDKDRQRRQRQTGKSEQAEEENKTFFKFL